MKKLREVIVEDGEEITLINGYRRTIVQAPEQGKQYSKFAPWTITPHAKAEIVDVPGRLFIADDKENILLTDGRWVNKITEADQAFEFHPWSAFEHLPDSAEFRAEKNLDRNISVTPRLHPRCLVWFPPEVKEEEYWGKVHSTIALTRDSTVRHDNGPAWNSGPTGITFPDEGQGVSWNANTRSVVNREGKEIGSVLEIPKLPPVGDPGYGGWLKYGPWTPVNIKWIQYWPVLSPIWGQSRSDMMEQCEASASHCPIHP